MNEGISYLIHVLNENPGGASMSYEFPVSSLEKSGYFIIKRDYIDSDHVLFELSLKGMGIKRYYGYIRIMIS